MYPDFLGHFCLHHYLGNCKLNDKLQYKMQGEQFFVQGSMNMQIFGDKIPVNLHIVLLTHAWKTRTFIVMKICHVTFTQLAKTQLKPKLRRTTMHASKLKALSGAV